MALYTFEPPTHEEPIRTTTKPLSYFRLTWANSVVRVNGVFTSIRNPSADVITAAGAEGTDYFRGGRIYTVDDATSAALIAAGYTTTLIPGNGGYGVGGYGIEGYGI